MAVREILLLGNPTLRSKCGEVENFSDRSVRQTIQDLRDTLADFRARNGFGRGIAAPQIGVEKRIIFININKPLTLINPEIIRRSRSTMILWDDCFSFPEILVKVKRNLTVSVRYYDEHGTRNELVAEASLSELLQHEIDHLDGILAIDRAIDSKHIVLRSEWLRLTDTARHAHPI